MTRLEELTLREIDGHLSRAESRELDRLLQHSPEAPRTHRQILDLERSLRNLEDEHFDVSDAVMEILQPAPQRKTSWRPAHAALDTPLDRLFFRVVLPLGAAAVFLATFLLYREAPYPRADLAGISGAVQVVREGRLTETSTPIRLRPGDRILVPSDAEGALRYRDRSEVRLSPGSQLRFEAAFPFEEPTSKRLELLSGRIEAQITPQSPGRPLVVRTPHAWAIVRGTRFVLTTRETETHLSVTQGQVDLRRAADGSTTSVTAGRNAQAASKTTSPRVTDGLFSLYNFQAGQGLLLQDVSGSSSPLPLSLLPAQPSAATWLPGHGLLFSGKSRLESKSPARALVAACLRTQSLTVEVWIQPGHPRQSGPARIVTLSRGSKDTNFTLAQEGDSFIARLATSAGSNPTLKASKPRVGTDLTHLVLTLDPKGKRSLWINGKLAARDQLQGDLSNWSSSLHLALAGDPSGEDRFWKGSYHLLALYNRALSEKEIQRHFQAGPHP